MLHITSSFYLYSCCFDRALWEILETEGLLDRRGCPYVSHINHNATTKMHVS